MRLVLKGLGKSWFSKGFIIAAQAQLEESANDRGSRRCPLVGMLRESGSLIRDPLLRASSSGYSVKVSGNRIQPTSRSAQICVFVCLLFFLWGLFESARCDFKGNIKKNRSKREVFEGGERRTGLILGPSPTPASSVVGTLLKHKLRRHLPRGFILVFSQKT
jgi:hypothetical protein